MIPEEIYAKFANDEINAWFAQFITTEKRKGLPQQPLSFTKQQ